MKNMSPEEMAEYLRRASERREENDAEARERADILEKAFGSRAGWKLAENGSGVYAHSLPKGGLAEARYDLSLSSKKFVLGIYSFLNPVHLRFESAEELLAYVDKVDRLIEEE